MDASIRRASLDDAQALAELGAATFAATFAGGYPPDELKRFVAANHNPHKLSVALADPEVAIWLAERGRRPIGFAQASSPPDIPHADVRPQDGEIKRLYLLAEAQGSGLGAELLKCAVDWLEGRGRSPVWLSVWGHGHAAQRFYARHGFEPAGEYDWPEVDFEDPAIIMRKG
jgi:ribosomal protein S18 acetylase RimI-like enzyme